MTIKRLETMIRDAVTPSILASTGQMEIDVRDQGASQEWINENVTAY
jgi:hypothetical protein